MGLIKLFAIDLDGCLTRPFTSPDWDTFSKIRSLNQSSSNLENTPPLSIITGRPQPYAEAIAQILDIQVPIMFESGAGCYDPVNISVIWSNRVTKEALRQIDEVKLFFEKDIQEEFPGCTLEFSKRTDAGIIHPNEGICERIFYRTRRFIEDSGFQIEVHNTPVSVNALIKGNNKGHGIIWLADMLKLELSEVAYIGDSSGDVPALQKAGRRYAPRHASEGVKKVDQIHVLDAAETHAVLHAYMDIIAQNEQISST